MNKSSLVISSVLVLCGVFSSESALAAQPRKAKAPKTEKVQKAPKKPKKVEKVEKVEPVEAPEAAEAAEPEPAPAPARASTTTTTSAAQSAVAKDASKEAPAEAEPKEARRISVGAFIGAGFNETKIKDEAGNETREGVGTQGVGLGVRGGYTLPINVYIGASFAYHLGGTNEKDGVKYTGSSLLVGPEVGYDLAAGPLVVRPYVGLGYGSAKAKAELNGSSVVDRSEGGFALWPGVLARYPIDMFFVGVDARFAVITGTDKITNANGFGAFVTGGATF